MLSKLKRLVKKTVLGVYYPIGTVYLWIVRIIINIWGSREGVHLVTVGEFTGGTTKTRSLYREDMLLKTMLLFSNLREKSCLDLACNDGFWSFRLSRFGIKRLMGIDIGEREITRANFLKSVYAFPSFQFKRQDLFQFLYHDNTESYDLILLLSIIYHLPEQTDWEKLFNVISRINNECLIIDSRWFEDEEYWYDKTSERTIIKTQEEIIKKWRPKRKEVFKYLHKSGYEWVIEVNPSAFLDDSQKAYGNGDPYTLENVSDYISNHRTIVIAYKKKTMLPDIEKRLSVRYV